MSGGVLEEFYRKILQERVKKENISQFSYFFSVSQLKNKNLTALLHCYQLTLPTETLNILLLP